jgi:hypothetical protein
VIADLKSLLCGNYFAPGNATDRFIEIDRFVAGGWSALLLKLQGRNLLRDRPTRGPGSGSEKAFGS